MIRHDRANRWDSREEAILEYISCQKSRTYKRLISTEKALAVRQEINDRIDRYVESVFVGISEEELEFFDAMLDRMIDNVL